MNKNNNELAQRNTIQGAVEKVILKRDLRSLTEIERVQYNFALCRSLGLNPVTNPVDYLNSNGKLVPYINAVGVAQLRAIHGVSCKITSRTIKDGCVYVNAIATAKDGRYEDSTAIVALVDNYDKPLKGQKRADMMMKAETKAKRRATLALMGVPWTDGNNIQTSKAYDPPLDILPAEDEF